MTLSGKFYAFKKSMREVQLVKKIKFKLFFKIFLENQKKCTLDYAVFGDEVQNISI